MAAKSKGAVPLKTKLVRDQFAAFADPELKRWAHFENAGGSYMCRQVQSMLDGYFTGTRVQPYYPYDIAEKAGAAMDAGYQTMAELLNVPVHSVYVGPSSSANTYVLSQAFAGLIPKGGNIIVTNQDHEANCGFWRRLGERGVEVREWSVNDQGVLEADALWPLIDKKTYFAAFPHASNIIGMINPVADLVRGLRERGVYSVVDGVSYVPHAWPDLGELGADVYFFSAYKTYGPHQGVMVIGDDLAAKLPNQGHVFNDPEQRKRLNPSGPDHAQVAALAGIGDYVRALYQGHFKGKASLTEQARAVSRLQREHESKHLHTLMAAIAGLKTFRLLGPSDVALKVPTVSLYHPKMTGAELVKKLSRYRLMTGGGHFYCPRVFQRLGLDPNRAALRLSFVHYVKGKDIERLAEVLQALDR
ncbi:MAG: aminotransferase class V-fold PLP-dependent enzyme [Rhodospirillales bacterium]